MAGTPDEKVVAWAAEWERDGGTWDGAGRTSVEEAGRPGEVRLPPFQILPEKLLCSPKSPARLNTSHSRSGCLGVRRGGGEGAWTTTPTNHWGMSPGTPALGVAWEGWSWGVVGKGWSAEPLWLLKRRVSGARCQGG